MNYGLLSLAQTPPLSVPMRYLVTAPIFAMIAAVVVILYPEMLSNRWSPVTLAVVHLLALGFVVMVMFGVLQQLLPVLAGVRFDHPVFISIALHIGLTIGTLALCLGFYLMEQILLIMAMAVLSVTIVGMISLGLYGLLSSHSSVSVVWGMRLPILAFLVTTLIGFYLTSGYAFNEIPLARHLTGLHYTWGLLGWVGLMVITVSYQVVPMFQITPKYPLVMVRWLVPGIFVLLVLWSLIQLAEHYLLPSTGEYGKLFFLALLAGFLFYIYQTLKLQYMRKRRLPDVTLNFWRLGLMSMFLSGLFWAVSNLYSGNEAINQYLNLPLLEGVLLIPGAAMSLINGMLYKIVPFLIWLHLTNQVDMSTRWQKSIPNMKKIIGEIHAGSQFKLHCLSLLALVVATIQLPLQPEILRVGAALLFLSNLYLFRNILTALKTYRSVLLS